MISQYHQYFEYFSVYVCEKEKISCQEFLKHFLGYVNEYPYIYAMTFTENYDQPNYYILGRSDENKFLNFIDELKKNKRKPSIVSEKTLEDYPIYYNDAVRKITRDSFSTFMTDNISRDAVILFYNSIDENHL